MIPCPKCSVMAAASAWKKWGYICPECKTEMKVEVF